MRALLLILLPTVASAQQIIGTRDSSTARVDSIFRAFDRTDAPGCALGIFQNGRILYARGYGMANLEHGIPITPRTVMDVGSVSKQFTATAVLLLAQEGKLRLDDPVRRHFPEMPPYAAGVTVRQMLNHLGGLRDYLSLWEIAYRSFEGNGDTLDFMRLITRSAETNWPVADRYFYSNTGYALAGQLVYRLSGQPLSRYLRDNVFDPLGMRDTRSLDDHAATIGNRAQGYAPRGTGFRIQASQFDGTGGAGSLHTTIEDFARWDLNWESGYVGRGAVAESLTVQGRLSNDTAISYALGVVVAPHRGLRSISHTGSWAGYRAAYYRFPAERFAVAAFCNVTNSGPDSLVQKVAAVYLGGRMGPDTVGAWDGALTSAAAVAVPTARLRQLAGVWRNLRSGEVRLTRLRSDSLMYGAGRGTALVHIGADRYRVGRTSAEVTFDSPTGSPHTLFVRGRGGVTRFDRVDGATPTPAQLAELAGDYRSEELEVTYTLAPDSGGLALSVNNRRRALLEPAWRDAFTGGPGLLEFQRDARGQVTGFALQAGRVRNLRFVRLRGAVAD